MSEKYQGMSGKLDKAYNIAFLSQLDARDDNHELWSLVSKRGVAKGHRMEAVLQLTDNVLTARGIPGFKRRLARFAYDESGLPFKAQTELVAHGFQNHVFRLHEPFQDDHFVLKTLMATSHMSYAELCEQASAMNQAHRDIRRFYRETPEIVLPSSVLILRSPYRGHRSIGILQQMVETPMSDLLRDYSTDEIAALCAQDDAFALMLSTFVGTTLDLWDDEDVTIDLVGRNNVAVVQRPDNGNSARPQLGLILTDTFETYTRDEMSVCPDKIQEEFRDAFGRLREIQDAVNYGEIAA